MTCYPRLFDCVVRISVFLILALKMMMYFYILLIWKVGATWFWIGAAIYVLAFIPFVSSFASYVKAPKGEAITNGVYRWSRNPMYFFFIIGMMGVCVASASLWMLLLMIPFSIFTHLIILGEERYCEQTYGESYLAYKKRTPRYFLFF